MRQRRIGRQHLGFADKLRQLAFAAVHIRAAEHADEARIDGGLAMGVGLPFLIFTMADATAGRTGIAFKFEPRVLVVVAIEEWAQGEFDAGSGRGGGTGNNRRPGDEMVSGPGGDGDCLRPAEALAMQRKTAGGIGAHLVGRTLQLDEGIGDRPGGIDDATAERRRQAAAIAELSAGGQHDDDGSAADDADRPAQQSKLESAKTCAHASLRCRQREA